MGLYRKEDESIPTSLQFYLPIPYTPFVTMAAPKNADKQVHWVCMPIYKASQPNKDQRHSSNSIRLLGGRRNMYRPSAHSRAIL